MGEARLLSSVFLLLILATPALAYSNRFDPYVDLNDINWFDAGLYFGSIEYQPCVDLEEYYAYADWDRYDRYERDDLKDELDRLSYSDIKLIAEQDPYDNIDDEYIRDTDDLRCSTKYGFDTKAYEDLYDGWDEDSYYGWLGYKDQVQFENTLRHAPYEVDRRYQRGYEGAVASWYAFS